ncbi:M20/M25/M40 family metallo-hydrolase [Phenylobacterium conjunctum]|uniref:M20/M25/M40 family metallo-hydrolase n=1 Tax=Phenylobacterium conjunctum TaxID=1298959 RepID=A0ABW3SZ69_9CAUL
MRKDLGLILAVLAGLVLAFWSEQPPRPLAPDAPATVFSAGRAMADVTQMAARPHPTGSPANAAVRDYLVGRMTALGLNPQVQSAAGVRRVDRYPGPETFVLGGQVQNIVGVLPGRDRAAPALAIMAHYDSVPGSPGAADDAAGVASALEIVRLLKLQGTPARDVIVLITDGEEGGLLGAQAFFDQHPLAKRIGYLLNMETRGGGGRVQMFQTAANNGQDVDLLARGARHPLASSLTVFIYKKMPNDTDFTVSDKAGVQGLNYAFIGRQFDYHSPTSTPANLSQGALQHMGEEVLGVARLAAFEPSLPGRGPDKTYSNIGPWLVAYPPMVGWGLLAVAAGLLGWAVARARKAGTFVLMDVAQGLGAGLYLIAASVTFLRLARRATGAGFGFIEQRHLLAQAVRWEVALALVAFGVMTYAAASLGRGRGRFAAAGLAFAAGLACSAFGGWDPVGLGAGIAAAVAAFLSFARPAGVPGAWTGGLALALLAAIGMQAAAPTTAFLFAWPILLASALAAATGLGAGKSPWRLPILIVGGALGLAWILPYGHALYLGLDLPELLTIAIWLSALVLWPLIQSDGDSPRPRALAIGLLAAGFIAVAVVRFAPVWSERHPQTSVVQFVIDHDAAKAWRVSTSPKLDPWSAQALGPAKPALRELPPLTRKPAWATPAPMIDGSAPAISRTVGPDGRQGLSLQGPGARVAFIRLRANAPLADVRLAGQPVTILDQPGRWTVIRWVGADQVTLDWTTKSPHGALEVQTGWLTDGWPAGAAPLPPRPKTIAPFDLSDSRVDLAHTRLEW